MPWLPILAQLILKLIEWLQKQNKQQKPIKPKQAERINTIRAMMRQVDAPAIACGLPNTPVISVDAQEEMLREAKS